MAGIREVSLNFLLYSWYMQQFGAKLYYSPVWTEREMAQNGINLPQDDTGARPNRLLAGYDDYEWRWPTTVSFAATTKLRDDQDIDHMTALYAWCIKCSLPQSRLFANIERCAL